MIHAESLSVFLGGKAVYTGLDFSLSRHERWAVLGANGVGKTTLLYVLAGLMRPARGEVRISDVCVQDYPRKALARKIGILFQDNQDPFPGTVLETVLAGRYSHLPFWAFESACDIDMAIGALEQVGLAGLAGRRVNTLSGGERRRTAIAGLMVQEPLIWLLDEPANHLDLHHQVIMLERMIEKVSMLGGSMLMVLHDVNLAVRFCTHALLMVGAAERISGTVDDVLTVENLHKVYRHPIRVMEHGGVRMFYPG